MWILLSFKNPFEYMFRNTISLDTDSVAISIITAMFTVLKNLALALAPISFLISLLGILYFGKSDKGERKMDLIIKCLIIFTISGSISFANVIKNVLDYIFGIVG